MCENCKNCDNKAENERLREENAELKIELLRKALERQAFVIVRDKEDNPIGVAFEENGEVFIAVGDDDDRETKAIH